MNEKLQVSELCCIILLITYISYTQSHTAKGEKLHVRYMDDTVNKHILIVIHYVYRCSLLISPFGDTVYCQLYQVAGCKTDMPF